MKPVIGLTSYRQRGQTGVWDTEMAMLPAFYLEGVTRAGGLAVILPPQLVEREDAATLLAGLDGLIVTGGRDVEAARYGATSHEKAERPDLLRDLLENELLTVAIQSKLPFLGICRGAQILNVNRGGTLIQHLPDVIGDDRYLQGGGNFAHMQMTVREGSLLASIVGDHVENAALYHHQAIAESGAGLQVVAYSPDGIVQAIEVEGHPFGLAVQWHPEQTLDDLRLFEALVAAAKSS